jgi:hypothetical protein
MASRRSAKLDHLPIAQSPKPGNRWPGRAAAAPDLNGPGQPRRHGACMLWWPRGLGGAYPQYIDFVVFFSLYSTHANKVAVLGPRRRNSARPTVCASAVVVSPARGRPAGRRHPAATRPWHLRPVRCRSPPRAAQPGSPAPRRGAALPGPPPDGRRRQIARPGRRSSAPLDSVHVAQVAPLRSAGSPPHRPLPAQLRPLAVGPPSRSRSTRARPSMPCCAPDVAAPPGLSPPWPPVPWLPRLASVALTPARRRHGCAQRLRRQVPSRPADAAASSSCGAALATRRGSWRDARASTGAPRDGRQRFDRPLMPSERRRGSARLARNTPGGGDEPIPGAKPRAPSKLERADRGRRRSCGGLETGLARGRSATASWGRQSPAKPRRLAVVAQAGVWRPRTSRIRPESSAPAQARF